MGRFFLKRLLLAIPTLFGIALITFAMIHLAPGDFIDASATGTGVPFSAVEVARQRKQFFLDLPLFYNSKPAGVTNWERFIGRITETQFAKWIARIATLSFGHSIRDGRLVTAKLAETLPITLLLSFISMFLAYIVAVPLGVHAAVRQGTLLEKINTASVFVLYSLPSFWVAMLLILFLGGVGYLDWFPIYGLNTPGLENVTGWTWLLDRVKHLILPIFCLTYGSLAVVSRQQRSAMLSVLKADYMRAARAKGLPEHTVIFKHGLRNALLPTVTLLGLHFPYLISGSVIIERIFNIPGMGLLTFEAFLNRDYPIIMAVSVLSAALTLIGLILCDLLYAVLDPRITLEKVQ